MKNPFEDTYHPFYALIEVASNMQGSADVERLFALMGNISEHIVDGIVA